MKAWPTSRLGYESWVRARLGWRGLKAEEYVDDGPIMLSTPEIKDTSIDFERAARIPVERYRESPEIALNQGDVLLAKDGSTLGTCNVVRALPEPATTNGSIAVITPTASLDPVFLMYQLKAGPLQAEIGALRGGMGVPHLFQDDIRRLRIQMPPLMTQREIADFLDRETAKIDALMAKQEQLVSALVEHRTALIANAVRGRFTSTGPTSPCGVKWIGELPASWSVRKVSHLFTTTGSGTTPENGQILDRDLGVPWVNTSELRETVIEKTAKSVSEETVLSHSALRVFPAGSILVAMYGATIGRLGALGIDATTNQACCALVGAVGITPEYAFYCLLSAKEELLLLGSGGGQPNISQDKVRALALPQPPMEEQRAIASLINGNTERTDEMVTKARELIHVMRERRTALISAAVTGQIDVTHYAKGA